MEKRIIRLVVIDMDSSRTLVLNNVNTLDIEDESGDFCEEKIIDLFNKQFDTSLKSTNISWGEIEEIEEQDFKEYLNKK